MDQNSTDMKALIMQAPDEAQGRMTFKQISWVGRVMYSSGMFKNTQSEAQAIVKIMAGSEMGMTPFESMNGMDIIEGQAVVKPHTMAGRIKRTAKYDFRVRTSTMLKCELDFYELPNKSKDTKKEHLGTSTFTIEQAQVAGLVDPQCKPNPQTGVIEHDTRDIVRYKKGGGSWTKPDSCLCKDNWKNYPEDMLYARAMSRGTKRFTPDVFGLPIYTSDEIQEELDEDRRKAEAGDPQYDYLPPSTPKAIEEPAEAPVEDPPEDDDNDVPAEDEVEPVDTKADEPEAPEEPAETYTPPATVNETFKQRVEYDLRDLELPQNERLRLLRKVTGTISFKSMKNDQQWRNMRDAVDELMTAATAEDAEGEE